jgi:ribulose 1,5-bisphosphate synthetase/thiazole synthase
VWHLTFAMLSLDSNLRSNLSVESGLLSRFSLKDNNSGKCRVQASLKGTSPVNPLDMLVIGGGATGCGVALDAATRGLRVGLVERDDFASGTSSRSTKLVHRG